MSKWRKKSEMKVPKTKEFKSVLVKLKSGKIHIGTCTFFEGKVHHWAYFSQGLEYIKATESCNKEDPIVGWKPLPKPEKIAELI